MNWSSHISIFSHCALSLLSFSVNLRKQLRLGLIPGSVLMDHSWQTSGTIWDATHGTQVSHLQGGRPTCCTICGTNDFLFFFGCQAIDDRMKEMMPGSQFLALYRETNPSYDWRILSFKTDFFAGFLHHSFWSWNYVMSHFLFPPFLVQTASLLVIMQNAFPTL